MSPLQDSEGASSLFGGAGRFINPHKLLRPGEVLAAKVMDITEDKTAKFKVFGKDYAYQLSLLIPNDSAPKRWSVNSKNLLRELFPLIFPKGIAQGFQPAFIKITKKTQVGPKESGLSISKGADWEAADQVEF